MYRLNDRLLTLEETAQLIKVSKISLRRWTRDGSLPCVRVGLRGDRRFRLEDIESYLAERFRPRTGRNDSVAVAAEAA
jgi:excisionase family DNA binding protein